MTEALLAATAIALCIIAYEVSRIRRVLLEQRRFSAEVHARGEVDEQLRHHYPTLFYTMRPELHRFFDILRQNRTVGESYRHHVELWDTLMKPSRWEDVYRTVSDSWKASTGEQTLVEIANDTHEFLRDVDGLTTLTAAEGRFLAYLAWHEVLGDGEGSGIAGQLRLYVRERFKAALEAYGRPVDAA